MEKNTYNIPAKTWNRLGHENHQNFNHVYAKCIAKRDEFFHSLTPEHKTTCFEVIDKIDDLVIDVVETAVTELNIA